MSNISELINQRDEYQQKSGELGFDEGWSWASHSAQYCDLVKIESIYKSSEEAADVLSEGFSETPVFDGFASHIDESADSLLLDPQEKRDNFEFTLGFIEAAIGVKNNIDSYQQEYVDRAVKLIRDKCPAEVLESRSLDCTFVISGHEIIEDCSSAAIESAVNFQLNWLRQQPIPEGLYFTEVQAIRDELVAILQAECSVL